MIASIVAAPAIIMSARSGLIAGSFLLSSREREQRIGANFFKFFLESASPLPLPLFLKSLFAISARFMTVPDDPHARRAPNSWTFGFNPWIFSEAYCFICL